MRVRVKICGLRTAADIAAAIEAGADAIGFVFDLSLRQLSPIEAGVLGQAVPRDVDKVAVFRVPTNTQLIEVREQVAPDWLQVSAVCLDDPEFVAPLPLIPTFEDGPDLIERVERYREATGKERPLVLIDGPKSGSGRVADWDRVAPLSAYTRLVLAGGLNPENVGTAIARVQPYGVDVSSGVESQPGVKDHNRIRAFMEAVRAASQAVEPA